MSCCDGCVLFAGVAAGGEQGDVDVLVKGMLVQFFHDIVFPLEGDDFTGGFGGSHQIEVVKGEIQFLQDLEECAADQTGRADDGKIGFFHYLSLSCKKFEDGRWEMRDQIFRFAWNDICPGLQVVSLQSSIS